MERVPRRQNRWEYEEYENLMWDYQTRYGILLTSECKQGHLIMTLSIREERYLNWSTTRCPEVY